MRISVNVAHNTIVSSSDLNTGDANTHTNTNNTSDEGELTREHEHGNTVAGANENGTQRVAVRSDGHGYENEPGHADEREHTRGHGYECVFCGTPTTPVRTGTSIEFRHVTGAPDCTENHAAKPVHQHGVEAACKTLGNTLTRSDGNTENTSDGTRTRAPMPAFTTEKRVGKTNGTWVTADALIEHPVNAAIEVVNKNNRLALTRRLQVYFEKGYDVYVIVVTPGAHSPDTITRHVQKAARVPGVDVGVYNAYTDSVSLGTRFSPFTINVDALNSSTIPAYIS